MPHGGYHGTVKMGGKTIQQGYQDNSGNYQIRGGIDDNSRLDKNPPRNVQPAQLPNIPDNLITNEMRLQNIVDNKDIFKNQPSPTRPGMNVYQDRMQDFRTSTPERMKTYAKRFPLTQMAMTLPEKVISKTLLGNIIKSFNTAKTGIGTLKDKISNVFKTKFEDPYSQASSSYDYDNLNIEGYPDEIQRRLQVGPISEEDTSETNIEAIKDEKTSYKNNKIQNAQDTFTFYNTLNNPSNVLPPNFAQTFERLKDTNQLTSGDFMKANQLLRDIIPTQQALPPMINAQNTGINQVLPKEIETANLFGNFQPNIAPIVDQVNQYREVLDDGKGIDLDLKNRGVSYSKPLFGGTLTGEISDVGGDNPTAGLFFNKVL